MKQSMLKSLTESEQWRTETGKWQRYWEIGIFSQKYHILQYQRAREGGEVDSN